MQKKKHNTDLIASVFVFALSLLFLTQLRYVSVRLDVIFPKVILIGLLALSGLLFFKALFRPDPESLKILTGAGSRSHTVLFGALGTVAWVAIFPIVGFFVTSTVALACLSTLLGGKAAWNLRKLGTSLMVSVILVSIIYYCFSTYLEVPLPRGLLF